MRAISLRTARSRPWLSSWPVAAWKRRLNSSIFASASLSSSSCSLAARRSAAASALAITPHHLRGLRGSSPGSAEHASRTLPVVCNTASAACASLTSRLAHLTLDELALHRQLVHGPAKCLPGHRLRHAGQLEHDAPGLDVGDPPFRRALARAHPRLSRLLGQRPIRVDRYPDLPASADVPGHRDSSGFDLPVRYVRVLHSLYAVFAESHPGTALCRP